MLKLLPTITSPADLKRLPVDRLPELAAEIREAICDQISRSGGHLAPNLGVVELTIALHYVFDFAHDRLLFDVGHQCYTHKLLTGRLPMLAKLRTRDGMAGFPEPRESEYDLFSVGHAGTGISTAVGMARGDVLNAESYDPIARPNGRRIATLIGDASIVNGVAMEGLNNAGTLKRQFLVVLNDNGMSIAKPQGAVARYFDRVRLSTLYSDLKRRAHKALEGVPGRGLLEEAYHRAGEATKAMVAENAWFEHFGLLTVGPIDGHDLPTLIEYLAEARDLDRPMVLHVNTIKGKGYGFAEGDACKFHSPAAFKMDVDEEGCRVELKKSGRSFTAAFGDALADLMQRDPKVVACTAAMPDGTGVNKVLPMFPDRTWDIGICESHGLDMMAGLAKTGFKPFFAVYSTFLQRAFDQCFQESALQGLPVRLCLDRAGLVGEDGAVHHGFCDVALLRTLPSAALTAAIDEPSLRAALEFMRHYEDGLSSVRYPRDSVSDRFTAGVCPPFELGKARLLYGDENRAQVAILAFGTPAIDAVAAAEMVAGPGRGTGVPPVREGGTGSASLPVRGSGATGSASLPVRSRDELSNVNAFASSDAAPIRVTVYDARFAKPVDTALIRTLLERKTPIITIEDHGIAGGFGAAVLEAAADMRLDASRIIRLALPDHWIYQDPRAKQIVEAGLDAASIAKAIRQAAAMAQGADAEALEVRVASQRMTGVGR